MKEPIFMLGPGRCGSTLLQRIVNTSPDITMWGEHAGFLKGIATSYQVLKSPHIQHNYYSKKIDPQLVIGELKDYQKSINWVNAFTQESVRENYRQLIINLLNNKTIDLEQINWGFKEILYMRNDGVLPMLLELFPDCKIIFSLRHPFDVIKSMILSWSSREKLETYFTDADSTEVRESIKQYAQRWNNVVSGFQAAIATYSFASHIVHYENLVADPEKIIAQLFAFLTYPTPSQALQPMSVKVEYSQNSPYEAQLRQIIIDMSGEIWSIVGESAAYFNYQPA